MRFEPRPYQQEALDVGSLKWNSIQVDRGDKTYNFCRPCLVEPLSPLGGVLLFLIEGEIMTKTCTKCGAEKSLECFHRYSRSPDGRRTVCKDCMKAYYLTRADELKHRRVKNADHIKKVKSEYRKNNRDKIAEYMDKYRAENQDKLRAHEKEYYAKNKALCCMRSSRYRNQNKEKVKAWRKSHSKTPEGMAAARLARVARRGRLKNSKEESAELRVALNKIYSKKTFKCFYCEKRFPIKKLHIDHYIAVSKGGRNTADNIVTACAHCNLTKSTKDPVEFQNSRDGQMVLGVGL